jgi:hypothetical protein
MACSETNIFGGAMNEEETENLMPSPIVERLIGAAIGSAAVIAAVRITAAIQSTRRNKIADGEKAKAILREMCNINN